MQPIIKIENLSKQYRLGTIGTGTVRKDLQRLWARLCGKEDPFLKIGDTNDRSIKGNSEFVWALRDINLEVMPGEILGIIGKNGAGKSTLLKILSKVTGPTTGSIFFNGRIGSLLEVGTGFHPELTGRENIFLNGAILGMTKTEILSKLDEIIEFSGCERYIDTPVKRYSSGMTVRLGFAVAAHLEPEILVVDEVLAVGDAEFQKKAIGKMQDVSKNDGRTVIFVSHNMASIQTLCTSSILLQNGLIRSTGNTQEIINQYMRIQNDKMAQNLVDRTDRLGNQNFKINSVIFKNALNKEKVDVLLSGSHIIIELEYSCNIPALINNLHVFIGFSHISGGEKIALNNRYVGTELNNILSHGKIYCEILKWPLNSGTYVYRIHVEANGIIEDRVEDAGKVLVEYGDFFGTGYKVPEHLNGTLILHKWYQEID